MFAERIPKLFALAPVLPALIFITAGLSKAVDPLTFLYQLPDYQLDLTVGLQAVVVLFLPLLEIVLGLKLLLNPSRPYILLSLAVVVCFTIAIIVGLPGGYLQRCGCLGSEDIGPAAAIVKNLLLVTLLLWSSKKRPGLDAERNHWGAIGLLIGGIPAGYTLLGIGFLCSLTALRKQTIPYLIGTLLGWYLHRLALPVTWLPLAALLFYLPRISRLQHQRIALLVLPISVFTITVVNLLGDSYGNDVSTRQTIRPPIAIESTHEHPTEFTIWITANLRGQWETIADSAGTMNNGLLHIARALDLYRNPADLLIDAGNSLASETEDTPVESFQTVAEGYLKALARLNYQAVNVANLSTLDSSSGLVDAAYSYNLPVIAYSDQKTYTNIDSWIDVSLKPFGVLRIVCMDAVDVHNPDQMRTLPGSGSESAALIGTVLIAKGSRANLEMLCQTYPGRMLVLWLGGEFPTADQIAGNVVLGLGQKSLLGWVRIRAAFESEWLIDLAGWNARHLNRHHPVREWLSAHLLFWKPPPHLQAFRWSLPVRMTPDQITEAQMKQTERQVQTLLDKQP